MEEQLSEQECHTCSHWGRHHDDSDCTLMLPLPPDFTIDAKCDCLAFTAMADVTVIGPECFASSDGAVVCWRGENYYRRAPADDCPGCEHPKGAHVDGACCVDFCSCPEYGARL